MAWKNVVQDGGGIFPVEAGVLHWMLQVATLALFVTKFVESLLVSHLTRPHLLLLGSTVQLPK